MDSLTALTVNGVERDLPTDAAGTSLLSVLRDHFDQRDARFGCGQGLCGACVVLVDGVPTTSCDRPVTSVAGASVTTVAGLAAEDDAVQRAFLAEQAAQCGYCLSGILVGAAALLRRDPDPDEATVRQALSRHLCRCGAQPRMIRAVLRAAREMADR